MNECVSKFYTFDIVIVSQTYFCVLNPINQKKYPVINVKIISQTDDIFRKPIAKCFVFFVFVVTPQQRSESWILMCESWRFKTRRQSRPPSYASSLVYKCSEDAHLRYQQLNRNSNQSHTHTLWGSGIEPPIL